MRIRARCAGIMSKRHCSPPASSILARRANSPERPHRNSSTIMDLKGYRSRIHSPRRSAPCSCTALRVASVMSSFAPRTVSSAISVRKRRRAVPWWAFTPRCNFPRLVIPDQASHGNDSGNNRPGCDSCNQHEERKLGDIISACFCAKEFTA